MHITIINDCKDDNAFVRQSIRASTLIGAPVTTVGVTNDIEASGNIIDALDAYQDRPGIILVNIAPRHGVGKKWPNGTPFGYFWYNNILIVVSISGYTLSLVKKLGLITEIKVLDIPTVMNVFLKENSVTQNEADKIINTQFRSYEFLPLVASYLFERKDVVHEILPISEIPDVQNTIWWIDNFGNCKTTLIEEEKDILLQKFPEAKFYNSLKDVPNDTTGIIVGSSGIGEKRFLEIVIQGKNASEILGLQIGKEF
jgi:hypothetical protein